MRLLLAGTGYLGQFLLKHWEAKEDRFVAITTTKEKVAHLKSMPLIEQVIVSNLALESPSEELIKNCEAMLVSVAPKAGGSYEEVYLGVAQSLKRALEQSRILPLTLIYVSSTSVYGPQKEEWIEESVAPNPQSATARTLYEAENLYLSLASPLTHVYILRLGGIYGPGRSLKERALAFAGKEMPGSGDWVTNHSHIEDVSNVIQLCLNGLKPGIYNVVGDDHPTREALYGGLCKEMGLPMPKWNPELPSKHGLNQKISNRKLKSQGYVFKTTEKKKTIL